jgi:hypothetical protein
MRRWSYILGGLLIWALHFSGVYAIASLEAQTQANDAAAWRRAAIVFSFLCLAACLAISVRVFRRWRSAATPVPFHEQLAALGGGVAAIAVGWQTLPALLG